MQSLQSKIAIQINSKAYKKDPLSSDLGNSILQHSIDLIEELGFERFTFKKLATHIQSTEASIYRYFDNKRYLLAYLCMWYWSWTEYRVMMETLNIQDPKVRLKKAIHSLTKEVTPDNDFAQIDEAKLYSIVIMESSKVYFCKTVDKDNKAGFFMVYKSLVQRVADIILEIRPNFKYPHMLVSTVIEGTQHQRFFADHLPRLTDVIPGEDAVTSFYTDLVMQTLAITE